LAQHLGIDPTTVSAWGTARRAPRKANLEALRHFFGVPTSIHLSRDLIFLMDMPVSHMERRRWVEERLKSLSAEELKDLFPALERLFR